VKRSGWKLPERTARMDSIHRGLQKVMREIGAVNLDIRTKPMAEPPRAGVYFELDGMAFWIEADGHSGSGADRANLRAVEQYLASIWNGAKEGVGGFESTFAGLPDPGSHHEASQRLFSRLMGGHQATPDEVMASLPALPDPNDPLRVLGLQAGAMPEEIRERYRVLARELHPDVRGGDAARFKAVKAAYNALIDREGMA